MTLDVMSPGTRSAHSLAPRTGDRSQAVAITSAMPALPGERIYPCGT